MVNNRGDRKSHYQDLVLWDPFQRAYWVGWSSKFSPVFKGKPTPPSWIFLQVLSSRKRESRCWDWIWTYLVHQSTTWLLTMQCFIWKLGGGHDSPLKGSRFHHPKKVTKNHLVGGVFFIFYYFRSENSGNDRKWSSLTNMFQLGWNHQLEKFCLFASPSFWLENKIIWLEKRYQKGLSCWFCILCCFEFSLNWRWFLTVLT